MRNFEVGRTFWIRIIEVVTFFLKRYLGQEGEGSVVELKISKYL